MKSFVLSIALIMSKFTEDLTLNLNVSLDALFKDTIKREMVCVEIGSFEGKGSILIHNKLCTHNDSRLICIDPLNDEYVKGNDKLSFWNYACKGQYHRFYENTKKYNKISLLKGTSDDMIKYIEKNSIDFVYIDGDHSPHQVYKDAANIFSKMKVGGIVLFDDYLWKKNDIVTKHGVDKFLSEYAGKYDLLFKGYQLAIRITQRPFEEQYA